MEFQNKPINEYVAWTGAELSQREDWISHWTEQEISEIHSALEQVKNAGKKWGHFGAAEFPLPSLESRLADIDKELQNGRGFVLLRGLPTSRYSVEELETIYWGLSIHLGKVMSQNAKGSLIEHVTDLGPKNLNDPNLRLYVTAEAQPPHADLADVVGLMCVDRAKEGGESVVVSMMTIYNRILKEHPEYLPVLYDGFYHDMRGEGSSGELTETTDMAVPVFSYVDGKLRSFFHGKLARRGSAKRHIKLSSLQLDAIEYIEALAADPHVRLDMRLERGDIQLLNNHSTLHCRTAFVDGGGHKRLMLRVWIQLASMTGFHPATEKWVRPGVHKQDWAKDKPLVSLGMV